MSPFIAVVLLYCSSQESIMKNKFVHKCYMDSKKMEIRKNNISEMEPFLYTKCKSNDNLGNLTECDMRKVTEGCSLTMNNGKVYDSEYSCSSYTN